MKNYITIIIISLIVACGDKDSSTSTREKDSTTPALNVSMYDSLLIDQEIAMNNPYELAFNIERSGANQYSLISTMKLFGGSFYVSPHSTTDSKGRFTIELQENDHLIMGDDFVESPRSKEVLDPHQFINGLVNWVQEDTRYDHQITVTSQEDFGVRGKFRFTIEPKCTLEEIPFIIKYRSGVLSIEKWLC